MRRLPSKRVVPLIFVCLLVIGQSAGIANAAPQPARPASTAALQSDPGVLPGFDDFGSDIRVIASAIGDLDPAIGAPATLTVERLRVLPGDELPAVDGAQIVEVEHGALAYTDDLGLDAELQADTAAYFAAGSATPITNEGSVPAIVLRTTLSGAPAESGDTDESPADPGATGERPTATATPVGQERNDALTVTRDLPSSAKKIATATPKAATPEAATPEASPVAATPVASPATETPETAATPAAATPTPEPTTPPQATARLGVLLEVDLADLPTAAQQFFAAELELQPGATLELTGSSGPIGMVAFGGDLTVQREGHAPAKLRDGRSVLLPTGTSASFVNDGDAPLTLQIAGISGERASAPDTTVPDIEETPIPDTTPAADDNGPIDTSGPHHFIPSDSEMEHFGLYVMPDLAEESTNAAENVLWFSDDDEATDKLNEYDWQNFVLAIYTGNGEATEYGDVTSLALNVDTFADSDGATQFYNYIRDDIFQGGASHSRDISQLNGVDAEMRDTFYNSDDQLDYGFMVIRSGEYVISLYLRGEDLNAIGLMEAVANLIFGPRG
jgi:hypothetical protein